MNSIKMNVKSYISILAFFTDSNGQSWTASPTGKVHAPGDPIE